LPSSFYIVEKEDEEILPVATALVERAYAYNQD
jgi:hypothetical protein